jgi:UDP:flavonoid glycosyltransferase YjiC (YdhE family)
VLLSCSPGLGHFHPSPPLGRALRRQGHAVTVLTSATLGEAVAEGFELLPAGPGIEALVAKAQNRRPELAGIATTTQAAIPIFADLRVEMTLPEGVDPRARANHCRQ